MPIIDNPCELVSPDIVDKTRNSEIERLRYLIWLNHGHRKLYGDDGEMQCVEDGYCDFRKGTIDEIEDHIDKRGAILKAILKENNNA
jgi:hypothetical protein